MARYKPYSYAQGKFIPIHFEDQILPVTFEYALIKIIENQLYLSVFNPRFNNDKIGKSGKPIYTVK